MKKRRQWNSRDRGVMANYQESNNDFTQNNMDACIWFLENRDALALAVSKRPALAIPKELAEALLDTLERIGCAFLPCPGPDKRPVDMMTCHRCRNLRTLRRFMKEVPRGKQRAA